LDTHDVVGVNLSQESGNIPKHFSGNFWWMRYDHFISHLPILGTWSHSVEFWAASSPDTKSYNICSSNVNHYNTEFPDEIYKPLVDEAMIKI
jgi:hypothetical protein